MHRILLILTLLFSISWLAHAQTLPESFDLNRISQATVYLMQVVDENDNAVLCIGTGTLVSRDGLILANAHNTVPNRTCPGSEIIVAFSTIPDAPPLASFRAQVVQADEGLDIALLRIDRNLDGRRIDVNALSLPFVELGDSSDVVLDDSLLVVGYPDIFGSPVETRRASVSGFVTEPSAPDRAWIKIETRDEEVGVPGAMAGGGVYNQLGRLVGIPTTVPIPSIVEGTSCITLQDTNDDALITRSDECVSVGGFINALRPSNFARPLLRAASLGISVERITEPNAALMSQEQVDQPTFTRLFFSTAVTEGMPTRVVDSLPANPRSLFLFFDYANMTPETVYELRVTIDNRPDSTFSLAPVRWSGGTNGLWYIGSSELVWPNGFYEFTLFINGLASGTSRIRVGGAPSEAASFSNVLFGISDGGGFFGTGYVLPTGNEVTARFNYQNMSPEDAWVAIWYLNGTEIPNGFVDEDSWQQGATGSFSISLLAENGLSPGRYRLELYVNQVLAATADFTVAGAAEGAFPRVFSNPRFVTAPTPTEATDAIDLTNFPNTVRDLYMLFDWEQIAPGTLWTMRWFVDNEVFFEQTIPWNNLGDGQNFLFRLSGTNGIPDGAYRVELLINTVRMASDEADVGIGQLPIDVFAQAGGVQLIGQIIDAETLQGIPSVTFVLISEDYSVADFVWDSEQIYAIGTTDRNGYFQLNRPLQFGAPYSVIISAEGYLTIAADAVVVDEDTPNPVQVIVPLTRD
jgi:hypothetical protein